MNRPLALASILCLGALLGCAKEPPMTGAYSSASMSDPSVRSAAEFALQAHAENIQKNYIKAVPRLELVKIASARKQVVAGMNYDLTLIVRENGVQRTADAVVYQHLPHEGSRYELTSWVWK